MSIHLMDAGARVHRFPVLYDAPLPLWDPAKWSRRFTPAFYFSGIQRCFLSDLDMQISNGTKLDAILFYRCRWLHRSTLRAVREIVGRGTVLMEYNVDNSFSQLYRQSFWERYNDSLPEFDVCFAIRPSTISKFLGRGCRRVELLPHSVPDGDFNLGNDIEIRERKLIFVGHYESDMRVSCIRSLLDAGIDISIHGPLWTKCDDRKIRAIAKPSLVYSDYLAALSGSRGALAFLSTLNDDVYTNRIFEVPARGAFLISVYRPEIEKIYGNDMLYFETPSECLNAVRRFQAMSPSEINKMRRRCYNKAYDLFRSSVGARTILNTIRMLMSGTSTTIPNPYGFLAQ